MPVDGRLRGHCGARLVPLREAASATPPSQVPDGIQTASRRRAMALCAFMLPRGTDLSVLNKPELDAIAWEMDTPPRKTLGMRTPAEVLFDHYIKALDGSAPTDALRG